jgi:hypothetical protein
MYQPLLGYTENLEMTLEQEVEERECKLSQMFSKAYTQ